MKYSEVSDSLKVSKGALAKLGKEIPELPTDTLEELDSKMPEQLKKDILELATAAVQTNPILRTIPDSLLDLKVKSAAIVMTSLRALATLLLASMDDPEIIALKELAQKSIKELSDAKAKLEAEAAANPEPTPEPKLPRNGTFVIDSGPRGGGTC